jgi:hypothetical protein
MRVPYISFTHLLYVALGACFHYAWQCVRALRSARHTYTVRRHLESSQDSVVIGTATDLDGEAWQLREPVAKTCWPKYHGVTDSRYCGLHGWEAGWPCSKVKS